MNRIWEKAIRVSADPERVRHALELMGGDASPLIAGASAEQARVVAALLSGSKALAEMLVAHQDWLSVLDVERLRFPRRAQGLRNEVEQWLNGLLSSKDFATALARVHDFKQREMIRIAARDLARLSEVTEITRELSEVADTCLDAVWRICREQFAARYGEAWHQDEQGRWRRTEFSVLGMGKLGGQELNYSSDVDVLFVYSDEGQVFKESPMPGKMPRAVLPSHQFFNRLAEAFIAEVSRMTPAGVLFRIDLRLRPEGDAGPLCRSLSSYENYYAQWGQTWERMMLIKARGVAGSEALAAEFLEMIQPFRYPRAIQESVLTEIGAMKARIEREVLRSGELERNVKLGRGGIREIEFIAQSQQLLRGGKLPFLQGAQTLPALESLARYQLLQDAEVLTLQRAYRFLRDIEHRLQMEENLQTHTIPEQQPARERLAKLMGFDKWQSLERARRLHCAGVRKIFDKVLKSETPAGAEAAFPHEFKGSEEAWKALLREHAFRDPEKAFQLLREFVEGPGYIHVSPRTIELARKLVPRLLAFCPQQAGQRSGVDGFILSDPDRVVTRLDSFIAAYGARSVLFELWNTNPTIFDLLVKLFDRSEFLAEMAIRTADLVDELVTSGRLRQRKSAKETLQDLLHGIGDKDQSLWLRRYHEVELMRIGLRDILGLADPEQYLVELSALADASLQYAMEVAARKHKFKEPPFSIIGLGKLGGAEIDYGSDLDILFVADNKTKNLRKLQQAAVEVMELLSKRTERGIVFQTDARLRPDGEKGLLVNTVGAFEEYYRTRAQLWELQSLTRTRWIAGDAVVGAKFQELATKVSDFKNPALPIAAYSIDWKQAIHRMRLRIERERTPAGKDDLAIKTGKGGLMDAEFLAQALCLDNGWHEPNTLSALERGLSEGVLPGARKLIDNYRELRRVEGILRRWSYEGETVLPDDPAAYYRVAVRCGFLEPDEFRKALARWRTATREVYSIVFEK